MSTPCVGVSKIEKLQDELNDLESRLIRQDDSIRNLCCGVAVLLSVMAGIVGFEVYERTTAMGVDFLRCRKIEVGESVIVGGPNRTAVIMEAKPDEANVIVNAGTDEGAASEIAIRVEPSKHEIFFGEKEATNWRIKDMDGKRVYPIRRKLRSTHNP